LINASSDTANNVVLHPPTTECGFCFHFKENIAVKKINDAEFVEQPAFVVVGPQTHTVQIRIPRNYISIRLGLQPGAMYRLTGRSLSDFTDKSFCGEEIFGVKAAGLNQLLAGVH